MEKSQEQVLCYLHYPGRGFEHDKVLLVGVELNEWEALKEKFSSTGGTAPRLAALLSSPLPHSLQRPELIQLVAEVDKLDQFELANQLEEPALSGYFTLSMFLSQAHDQREAGALFENAPGMGHEDQTLLLRGVDVLADLEEINRGTGG